MKRFRNRTFACLSRPRSSAPTSKALLFRLWLPLPRELRSWKEAALDTCPPSPLCGTNSPPRTPSFVLLRHPPLPALPHRRPLCDAAHPSVRGEERPWLLQRRQLRERSPPPARASERGSPLSRTRRGKSGRGRTERRGEGGEGTHLQPGRAQKAGASRSLYRGTARLDPNSRRIDRKIVANPIRFWVDSKRFRFLPVNFDATPAKSAPLQTISNRFKFNSDPLLPISASLPPISRRFREIRMPFPAERIRPPPSGLP